MTGWGEGRLLVLDTETTGVDVESDRIVTACAAIVDGDDVSYRRSWLIAVDVDIPAEATAVHGVTTERARAEGVPAVQAVKEIAGALRFAGRAGLPVVAFNAVFDLTILDRECRRHGYGPLDVVCDGPVGLVIDPLVIDKAVDRYRPGKRQLAVTCPLFGVELGDDAHDADADAVAAGRLAHRMWLRSRASDAELMRIYGDRKYPRNLVRAWRELADLTAGQMHQRQVGWHADQAANFAQYLRQQGNEKLHEAGQREHYDGDGPDAATLRQEADDLFARADTVGTVWPYQPEPAVAVAS